MSPPHRPNRNPVRYRVRYPVRRRERRLPRVTDRLLAWVADSVVICLLWIPLVVLVLPTLEHWLLLSWATEAAGLLARLVLDRPPSWAQEVFLAVAAWPLLSIPYYVLTDGLLGASVGKRSLGLVVLSRVDGSRCGPRRGLLRTLFRPLDGFFFGLPAVVAMRSTADELRLGDLAAGTVVVRLVQGASLTPEEERIEASERAAGAEGERRIREALLPLVRYGWDVFFGVAHPHFGNIDCLLVGPPGVFVLDSESHRGIVVEDPRTGHLLRDGVPFEEDLRAQLARRREHVLSSSRTLQSCEAPLRALLCFTRARLGQNDLGDFPRDALTLDLLPPYLQEGASVVDAELRQVISGELQRAYDVSPEQPGSPGRPVNGTV